MSEHLLRKEAVRLKAFNEECEVSADVTLGTDTSPKSD